MNSKINSYVNKFSFINYQECWLFLGNLLFIYYYLRKVLVILARSRYPWTLLKYWPKYFMAFWILSWVILFRFSGFLITSNTWEMLNKLLAEGNDRILDSKPSEFLLISSTNVEIDWSRFFRENCFVALLYCINLLKPVNLFTKISAWDRNLNMPITSESLGKTETIPLW